MFFAYTLFLGICLSLTYTMYVSYTVSVIKRKLNIEAVDNNIQLLVVAFKFFGLLGNILVVLSSAIIIMTFVTKYIIQAM